MTSLTVGSRFAATALAIFTLALMALVLFSGAPAPARAQDATVQPDTASCWGTAADPISVPHFLYGVDYPSADRAWAVGADISGKDGWVPLVLRWDGTAWMRAPLVWNGQGGVLYGVWDQPGTRLDRGGDDTVQSGWKPSPVWAVGETFNSNRTSFGGPLLFRLVGEEWQQYDLASLGLSQAGLVGSLYSISGSSPDDLWAVGELRANPSANSSVWPVSLALHWNGSDWQRVPIPLVGQGAGEPVAGGLKSIAAVSPSEAWAVGYWEEEMNASHMRPLVLHWTGGVWVRQAITGAEWGSVLSVTALSPTQAWAVVSNFLDAPTVLRWDGKSWQAMQTFRATNGQFNSLAAITSTDLWAAGGYADTRTAAVPLVGRLVGNASQWQEVDLSGANTSGGVDAVLTGIAASPDGDLWTVGQVTWGGPGRPSPDGLLWHHSAGCSLSTPTPTRAAPLNPPTPLPGNGSRTFPETGKTLNGIFLDYWNTHGGLPQQGYLISDLMGEVSDLNGKLYTVQYTERAVFEYHPEYQAPYNVLLSQLGTFEFRKRYPQGAPNQQPNTDPGSVVFQETGHRLGGRFLEYWQTHGGLMQQGYPISDEFSEVSALNGKTYRVQYFERAVFEYHPENQPPYDVLLSQLGRFRYDAKYSAATPTPTPSPTATPTARLIAHDIQRKAAANDRFLFWIDTNNAVYAYDSQENTQFLVSNRPGFKESLTCDDRVVAWLEGDVEGTASIRGYDVIDHRELTLVPETGPGKFGEGHMALDGAMLYYGGSIGGRYGIIARNWSTGQENLLVEGGYSPAQWGDVLLWGKEIAHCDPSGGHPPCWFEQALTMRKANHDALLTTAYGQSHFEQYAVDENRVVWVAPDLSGSGSPLHLYDVNSGADSVLSPQMANNPQIRGNLVAWAEQPQGQPGAVGPWSLLLYNLADKTTKTLLAGSPGLVQAQGIMGQKAVACTVGGQNYPVGPHGDLYLIDLGH